MDTYPSLPDPEGQVTSIRTAMTAGGVLTLAIDGRLDSTTTGKVWLSATEAVERNPSPRLIVDATKVDYCDGSGIGLLVELQRRQRKVGGTCEIRGLQREFRQMLSMFDPASFEEPQDRLSTPGLPDRVGRAAFKTWEDIRALIAFVGELGTDLYRLSFRPRLIRWKDALTVAETMGVDAGPIIALISFLMGLILAFQAAIPMRQFGADIYVANLVALSILREIGPLMTAILLAGRSGSAFAAELGTMRINEEIDALTTMGLDPVRFLVVPRAIAGVVMTPLLTVFADLVGVLGGSVVFLSLGFSRSTYYNQVLAAVNYIDFVGGLAKSVAFGIIIACIGCFRGLRTEIGAAAVGESATRSVVGCIILIIATDGAFSVIYFYLGI